MFYQYQILDYMLMAAAVVAFLYYGSKIKKLYTVDCLAFLFVVLLTCTLIRTETGFTHFVKMASAFMLYFIGRGFDSDIHKVESSLLKANVIVVFVNTMMFIAGEGFLQWGSARTFRGMYFYKSDFSIAMIYAIAAFCFLRKHDLKFQIPCWVLISFLVLMSNTRIALIILVLVFGLWLLYLFERKTNKLIRINLFYVVFSLLTVFAAVFLLRRILNLSAFSQYHFLNFEFESLSDVMNSQNTQGRNEVWEIILNKYKEADPFKQAFGIDFISDRWKIFDSHNGYLKILFCTGYVGLTTFILFVLCYITHLNKLGDRSLFYYNLSLIVTFLSQSISQSSIDFTQMTWVLFFFMGYVVSKSHENKIGSYTYNDDVLILDKAFFIYDKLLWKRQ